MSDLSILLDKAIKALPAKHPVRAEIAQAMEARADFSARGRKAWETRRAQMAETSKAAKPAKAPKAGPAPKPPTAAELRAVRVAGLVAPAKPTKKGK